MNAQPRVLRFEVAHEGITLGELTHVEQLVAAVLRAVGREVAGEALKWRVESVRSGSPITYALRPSGGASVGSDTLDRAVSAITSGLRQLEVSQERPAFFTDEAVEKARDLASVLSDRVQRLRFTSDDALPPVEVTRHLAEHATAILEDDQVESEGTVEGRLEALSVHAKKYFNVYEDLYGQRIECLFGDSEIPAEEIGAAIGRRVAVFGTLIYRGDGHLLRVKAQEIEVFPAPSELPSVDEMAGILA